MHECYTSYAVKRIKTVFGARKGYFKKCTFVGKLNTILLLRVDKMLQSVLNLTQIVGLLVSNAFVHDKPFPTKYRFDKISLKIIRFSWTGVKYNEFAQKYSSKRLFAIVLASGY